MTSKNLKRAIWLVLAMSATAFAAGPPTGGGGGGGGGSGGGPPDGGGGGGGGNEPPTTEAGFSLSVPAIIVGDTSSKFVITCPTTGWSELTDPSKAPVYYPDACAETNDGVVCVDEGDYFVQRGGTWQAPCMTVVAGISSTIGAWGDNLGGDAKLKVGSPIRVELVLWDGTSLSAAQMGYKVIKLEPAELDRLSDYGHRADDITGEAIPTKVGAIVHDPEATLSVVRLSDNQEVYGGTAGAEINATGKIVYGHNLRVSDAGRYRITYTLPNVVLLKCEDTDPVTAECSGNQASIDIVVSTGGGGGGGKGGGQGGGKPIK